MLTCCSSCLVTAHVSTRVHRHRQLCNPPTTTVTNPTSMKAPYRKLASAGRDNLSPANHSSRAVAAAAHAPDKASSSIGQHDTFTSVDAALDHVGITQTHLFVLFCVSLIWAGDAMEVMVLSYLGPAAACSFGFSPTQQSFLASAVFAGMVLGANTWGIAADALGRKRALLTSAATVVTAGAVSAVAPNYAVLLLSRSIVGFGLAGAPVAFTLLLEVVPSRYRGTWGTLVELAWTAGTVLEALMAWALLNRLGWRVLLLLSAVPLALLLGLGQLLPESPRYLLTQGDAAAAEAVLQRMAGSKKQHNPQIRLVAGSSRALDADNGLEHEQQSLLNHQHSMSKEPHIDGERSNQGDRAGKEQQQQRQLQQLPVASRASSSSLHQQQQPQHEHQKSCAHQSISNQNSNEHCSSSIDIELSPKASQQQQQQRSAASGPPSPTLDSPSQAAAVRDYSNNSKPQQLQAQPQQLFIEAKRAAAALAAPPYAQTTGLLMFGWAATSFVYYGLVQLVAQLHLEAGASAAGADGPVCMNGMLQVPSKEYVSVLVTAAAEVPAVAWAAFSTNWLGRRGSVITSLALTAACLVPVASVTWVVRVDGSTDDAWMSQLLDAGMFGSRLFIMSAFTLMWVFTPELYPTRLRAFGLGLNNACARVGGLLSPFAAVNLVTAGASGLAELVFAAGALAAGGAVWLIKHEDTAVELEEDS